MRLLSTLALLAMTSSLIAGDGGFQLYTCVSDSGRSNLTYKIDHYSGTTIPDKVVFGLDGEFITYAPEFKINENYEQVPEKCEEECLAIKFDKNNLIVSQGEANYLDVTFSAGKAVIKKGFFDHRPGYENTQVGALTLNCKSYYQQP